MVKSIAGRLREPSKAGVRLSPLITNFHKWSGKKRKLFFNDEQEATTKGLNNWGLINNPFAQLLSSPMRCEVESSIRLPKELLIQLKVEKAQGDAKFPFEVEASTYHSKKSINSYVLNSRAMMASKKSSNCGKWVARLTTVSSLRHLRPKDVLLTTRSLIASYEQRLQKEIIAGLQKQPVQKSVFNAKDGDIIIENCKRPTIFEIRTVNNCQVISINMSVVDSGAINSYLTTALGENNNFSTNKQYYILNNAEHSELVTLIFRCIRYFTD